MKIYLSKNHYYLMIGLILSVAMSAAIYAFDMHIGNTIDNKVASISEEEHRANTIREDTRILQKYEEILNSPRGTNSNIKNSVDRFINEVFGYAEEAGAWNVDISVGDSKSRGLGSHGEFISTDINLSLLLFDEKKLESILHRISERRMGAAVVDKISIQRSKQDGGDILRADCVIKWHVIEHKDATNS